MKKSVPLSWLCFLLLLCAGCASASPASGSSTNTHTTAQAQPAQITYVAIGASDTFGTGTRDPYNENWAADLAGMLGPRIHLINLGIPSIRIHDALQAELPVALDSHPRLVTIWLAVNDLANNVPIADYTRDLNTMISRLQVSSPGVIIAVANIPDLTVLPYFNNYDPQALRQTIQQYNTAIASVVAQHNVILVDLSAQNYNLQRHPEYISDDGLHPNELGYQQIAKVFAAALRPALHRAGITR